MFCAIGLDPAGPYFENTDPQKFVLIPPMLYLSMLFILMVLIIFFLDLVELFYSENFIYIYIIFCIGTLQRMGHVDFFPNGGYDQPKCPKTSGKLMHLDSSTWSQ